METIQDQWWMNEFSATRSGHVDYISRDGMTAVEVRRSASGSRGLYAGLMGLAIFLQQRPEVERGCLVLLGSRLSLERVKEEWAQTRNTFQDTVAKRLALVYLDDGKTWIDPANDYFQRIAEVFQSAGDRPKNDRKNLYVQVRPRPGKKFYEVFKILLNRWLQKEGPIPLGKLADEVGCSHPTVRNALERDSLRNSISYMSNRSVELRKFPQAAWNELLALAHEIRHTFPFRDRTGNKPDPDSLLNRLNKVEIPSLGLGGVYAARHWHPNFDLHGSPRLDLIYHAPNGEADLQFVKRVDPALTLENSPESSPALVVHVIDRATSQFAKRDNQRLPWADPVETVLDLNEMSLTVQASQLLNYLRPETRLG